MGILDMLHQVTNRIDSASVFSYMSISYNNEFTYPGGKIILSETQYLSTSMYVVDIHKDSGVLKYTQYSPIEPNTKSQPMEIYGELPTKECSFISNPIDGLVDNDVITVLLINNIHNSMKYRGIHTRLAFKQLITHINNKGGILDKQLYAFFLDDDESNLIENVFL